MTEAELCELLTITPRMLRDLEIGRLARYRRSEVSHWLTRNSQSQPLRSTPRRPRQTIYIVRRDGQCKIGISERPDQRFRALRTAGGGALEVIATFPGTLSDEKAAHRQWAHLRTVGEWFTAAPELLQWARDGAA